MKSYFVIAAVVLIFIKSDTKAQSNISKNSLVELIKEAYIYGYPVEQSYRVYLTTPDKSYQPEKLYNHFFYADKLATAASDNTARVTAYKATRNRGGAGPNNDTPYFGSLLDLEDEPVVLSVPDFGGRYFSFQFINLYNENVHYIGSSFGDTTATKYLLIGPKWKGKIPAGLKTVHFKDEHLNLVGRVLVEDDSTDLKNVLALQHQASLTPLSKWLAKENNYTGIKHAEYPNYYETIDSFFINLNNALQFSSAPNHDNAILAKLKTLNIGTGKGFNWNNYNAPTQQLIRSILLQTDSLLNAEGASGDIDFENGWQRTNPKIGHWETDYWDEALYIKHGFYAGHDETEAFYITPKTREGVGYFKGNHKYKVHFAKDSFPPLKQKGFWSITAYEVPGYFLLPNPIHRAAIRDRTKNLKYNADGSLDIYLQADAPSAEKISNWLPIAKTGSTVTFRVYLPQESLLSNQYKLPPIQTVE